MNEEPLKQARVVEEGPPAAGVEVVEPLPGDAPELNPVEALWSNLKGVGLANLTAGTLGEVTAATGRGVQRI